jgi:hypothetical protein
VLQRYYSFVGIFGAAEGGRIFDLDVELHTLGIVTGSLTSAALAVSTPRHT